MQRLMYGGLDRALVNLTRIYCTAYITTSVWTAYLACLPRYATPLPGCVKYFRQMNNSVGEGDGLSPSLDGEPVVFKCFGEGTRLFPRIETLVAIVRDFPADRVFEILKFFGFLLFKRGYFFSFSLWKNGRNF